MPYVVDLMKCIIDLLAAATEAAEARQMRKGEYEDLEKSFGFKHNVDGLLADAQLNHMNWTQLQRVGWVHNDLQHGTFAVEVKIISDCLCA